jgi:hypothetical protein
LHGICPVNKFLEEFVPVGKFREYDIYARTLVTNCDSAIWKYLTFEKCKTSKATISCKNIFLNE